MPKQRVSSSIIVALAFICLCQAFWIWTTSHEQPLLAKVVLDVPVNDHVSVYGAIQDSGGATVPFVYHYFIRRTMAGSSSVGELQDSHAFLRTREPAVIKVEGGRIKVLVVGQVLDFSSRATYQDEGVKFFDIDLTATQP